MGLKHISNILLCSILSISSYSFSQAPLSSYETETTNTNYNNILNEMSLPEMREAILAAWRHGINPQSYWTSRAENIFKIGTSEEVSSDAN